MQEDLIILFITESSADTESAEPQTGFDNRAKVCQKIIELGLMYVWHL